MKPERQCPTCQGSRVARRRRKSLLDYALSGIGLYPYRCAECEGEFRSQRSRQPREERKQWVTCPRCGGEKPDRIPSHKVPARLGNYAWRKMGIPGYRCPECRKRFFSIRRLKSAKD